MDGDYNSLAVIALTNTQALASMTTNPSTAPRLRARAFGKGLRFARPGGSLLIEQPGGVPVELEVEGAFRVAAVSAAVCIFKLTKGWGAAAPVVRGC